MSGWCPRCDAVTTGDGTCPECGTPLVRVDPPTVPEQRQGEPAIEVSSVVEGPPRARLRVAVAVAAVVLIGLAFVAGRGSGHGPPRTAAAVTTPSTTEAPQTAPQAQRTLGWRARAGQGITVTALSVRRIAGGDPGGDDVGQLAIRVQGIAEGRLLGLVGLELLDVGGGVFASAEERPLVGSSAAPVRAAGQPGTYLVDLGPTPGVDTLDTITIRGLVLSQAPSSRNRIELDSAGPWPAAPPLRAIEPATDSVAIDLGGLRLPTFGGSQVRVLPLRVAGAFVGGRRAVVTLRLGPLGDSIDSSPQVFQRQIGPFPVSGRLLAGNRVLCEQTTLFGQGPDSDPLVVVDCPAAPVAKLAVELGAGTQTLSLPVTLTS
jgi:hypothetical protein